MVLGSLLRHFVECRQNRLIIDGRLKQSALWYYICKRIAYLIGSQIEWLETPLVYFKLLQPLPIAHEEVGRKRMKEARQEEPLRYFGLIFRISAPHIVLQLVGNIHVCQMELRHLFVHK